MKHSFVYKLIIAGLVANFVVGSSLAATTTSDHN